MSVKKHSKKTKNKMSIAHKGEYIGDKNPNWKGGRTKNKGYIKICLSPDNPFISMTPKDDNIIMEHRLIMAKHLGRCLESYEMVHHINNIRDDNRIENLELINSFSEHINLYHRKKIMTLDMKNYYREYYKENRERLNKYQRQWRKVKSKKFDL
jgi:hypothetical protein